MCTASLITPSAPSGALRLVTNRDEQHTRKPATPPQTRRFGERTALMPIDPSSDGTWVAVNDAGLVVTLLNLNLGDVASLGKRSVSRGGVVPSLMHFATVAEAAEAARTLPTLEMMPFRLLLADATHTAVVKADGHTVEVDVTERSHEPVMLTSSGLGDALVEGPRRALFDADRPRDPAAQDAFHRHRWPDRPELSVAMCREDARTVSRTVVEVGAERVSMRYTPVSRTGEEGAMHTLTLPRVAEVCD